MKRTLSVLLFIAMVFTLVACSSTDSSVFNSVTSDVINKDNASDKNEDSKKSEESSTISEDSTEEPATSEEEVDEPAASEEIAEESAISEETEEVQEDASASSETTADFEEITVVDNDECIIKLTGIEQDNLWGYVIHAYLENKSSDKTYMFTVSDCSVNGVQSYAGLYKDVAPGKKAKDDITFYDDNLEKNGIVDFTDIELSFIVYDSDDWSADYAAQETIHVYPYGEEKVTKYVREDQPSDTKIVDNDDLTVIVTGYETDEIWGFVANLYIVNKSDKNLMVSVDDVSVNGYMADPFFARTISAGKSTFCEMTWSTSTLEENDITEVEEIEFKMTAYNSDDWGAGYIVDEMITLHP